MHTQENGSHPLEKPCIKEDSKTPLELLHLPYERDWAQDGEYTGPGDNPPGYVGDMYETNHIGHMDKEEEGIWTPVADCYNGLYAAFIVKACNSHHELVAALTEIASALSAHPEANQGNSKVHYCMHKAKAAIAKAEGGII
jgi:hypothetical protein